MTPTYNNAEKYEKIMKKGNLPYCHQPTPTAEEFSLDSDQPIVVSIQQQH